MSGYEESRNVSIQWLKVQTSQGFWVNKHRVTCGFRFFPSSRSAHFQDVVLIYMVEYVKYYLQAMVCLARALLLWGKTLLRGNPGTRTCIFPSSENWQLQLPISEVD